MATPVIPTPDPNVTPPTGISDPALPNELQGKSAAEIAEYYKRRESQLMERLDAATRNTPAPAPAPAEPVAPTAAEFWNNPAAAVKAVAVSREEFNAAAAQVRSNMIEMARIITKDKFTDFQRWEPKIREVLRMVDPFLQTDPIQWETAYHYVKGRDYDKDLQTATAAATARASEPPTPIPPIPVIPEKLTFEEDFVAKGLGQTPEKYREGKKNLADNAWPLTFDTRNRRK
jgi:hypothetical protein